MYPFESDKLYCELVGYVVNSEGGYVDNPKDPGGPTKYGVAWNYNAGILKELGVTSPAGMKNLDLAIAKQIYYKKYWLASGANHIPDKALAYVHFDAAVNHGVGFAAKCVFGLSKKPSGFEAGEGKNALLWRTLLIEYLMMRLSAYAHDKNWKTFLAGWCNRIVHLTQTALKF